ncbi:replicative DNA helicase [Caballeronia sp. BR00000012568055]|uniref:replicative DNA helicase n=1 Tax=Caballeronia sp. BR00000012568055 TaxID=2918761 RepID=UPI0023F76A33|nr:replicative DNA helicase [Caballeronia sp. BR00000012568055]
MTANELQRSIPSAVEAEQSVIGGLLLDNDAIDRIGHLRAGHFFRADHRVIFKAVTAAIAEGGADPITVNDRLRVSGKAEQVGGLAYLNAIAQSTPSAVNISRYADIVRDRSHKRRLLAVAHEIQDSVGATPDDAATLIDRAASKLEAIAEGTAVREPKLAAQGLAEHLAELERRSTGTSQALSTGLADLDHRLNSGLRPGWLAIVAARPGVGKTALALNIATHVAQTHSVLFCSMEMPEPELHDRMIASLGRVSLDTVMHAPEHDNEFWNRMTTVAAKVTELRLRIDDQAALRLADVRAKARAIKRKHGLDLIIVDYLQLMTGDGSNRNSEIEGISRGLKALAKELNIAVIALAQLNRQVEQRAIRIPQLSDLRDSGAIEQDADVVMFVHREEVANPDCDEQFRGFAQVRVAKFRHGSTGDIPLRYRGEHVTFEGWTGAWPTVNASRPSRIRGFD